MEKYGSFGGKSIAKISYAHPTFLTPDGVTFSMWSSIYLFQGLFTIYQLIPRLQNSHAGISRARVWVIMLYIACCLWVPVFCRQLYWPAFALLLVMNFLLVMIYRAMMINYGAIKRTQIADMMLPSVIVEEFEQARSRLGRTNQLDAVMLHPWLVKVLCFTGFSLHLSCLVYTACVDFLLTTGSMGWHQPYSNLDSNVNVNTTVSVNAAGFVNATSSSPSTSFVSGSENFAIMFVCIIGAIACALAVRHCDVPFAAGTAWALGGVYRAQTFDAPRGYPDAAMSKPIADWTLAVMIAVCVVTVIGLVKAIVESVWARKRSSEEQNGDEAYFQIDSEYDSLHEKSMEE